MIIMVRSEQYLRIKQDPIRWAKLKANRRRYKDKRRNDPIRYAHYLEKHRLCRKRNYYKHRDEINRKRVEKYRNLSEEEKILYKIRSKKSQKRIRKRFIIEWGNKCQKCGYSEHPEILQFDHRIPLYRKTNGIKKRLGNHMLKDVREHPEDFELLCPNCHRIKTHKEITALSSKNHKELILNDEEFL